jgi:two-component system sensor histidine kinase CpxA
VTVKIFARVFFVYWIAVVVMVALTLMSVTTSPSLQANRLRNIPLDDLRICAERELTLYQTGGTSALQRTVKGCEDGLLISRDGLPVSGAKLSAENTRLVMEVTDGRNLTVRTSPRETTVALRVGSEPSGPFVYLAIMPVPSHPFYRALIFNNLIRLVFVGGGFCYLLTIFFIRPITTLSHVAEQFGAGDLKARVPGRTSLRTDEFGELGRAFNEMATRIESLVARYKAFLAQASHELGSPLTRLNIALALAKRVAGPEIHPALRRIGREADNLNSLVQELLLLARLESGNELARKAVAFNVASIVDEACANASFEAGEQSKSVFVSRREDYQLVGYPDLLQRALDNVLRNGVRFCRAEGRVQISFFREQGGTVGLIRVSDDGDGVPAGKEENIFEAFVTLEGGSSERAAGSGLGLAIARQAVLAHQGRIYAENSPGSGLCVTIEIPIGLIDGFRETTMHTHENTCHL